MALCRSGVSDESRGFLCLVPNSLVSLEMFGSNTYVWPRFPILCLVRGAVTVDGAVSGLTQLEAPVLNLVE